MLARGAPEPSASERAGRSRSACLADRRLLQGLANPALAAYQFAGLVMYQPMNQVMFGGTDALPPADQLNRIAGAAVDTFLATYG